MQMRGAVAAGRTGRRWLNVDHVVGGRTAVVVRVVEAAGCCIAVDVVVAVV